jgi:hypothetical protein
MLEASYAPFDAYTTFVDSRKLTNVAYTSFAAK